MSVPFYGDYDTSETVVIPFNTFTSDDPQASSTITNLANTDIHIHKDGGTTQRSSSAGVTVSIDFDSITGNHICTIDLSDNTDAGFYADGSTYQVRMEGTTVDAGTINAWIGSFSIGRMLRPTTAGRTLDVTATGAAGIDWGNVENQSTAVDLSATDIQLCDTVTTNTDMRGTDSAATAAELAKVPKSDGTTSWNATALGAINAEADTALSDFFTSAANLVDLIWDEVITGAAHNTANSAARFLREAFEGIGQTGEAQAGAAGSITLAAGESATDDFFRFERVRIIDGTGAGQSRIITGYTGSSKVATVHRNWDTNPDSTSIYSIVGAESEVIYVNGTAQTAGDLAALITTLDTVADGIQSDLDNGTDGLGALKTLIDTVDTVVDGIQTDLSNGTDGLGALKTAIEAVMTTQMTEAYAADGVAPTPAQALFLIQQILSEFAIASTTKTVKKLDGSTTAATFTLDDDTNPTSLTRAT